jgi:hypothetical protein
VYEFSRSRSRDAPLTFLADYRGYLQADAYPGYDPLFMTGKIIEVACNVHARRKFVGAPDLLKTPGRPHAALAFYREMFRIEQQIKDLSDEFVGSERAGHAAAIYYSPVESCKANKVNPLTYLTYVLSNARSRSVTLPAPDEFTASNIAHVG